jgi:glycosyltransferase involved in cell wall biosynthesis
MRIAIDARLYGLENAGIGRYVMNLINQIEKLDKENKYFILLRKKYFNQLEFKNKNFKKILVDYPHYSLKEQIFLPLQLIKIKPDLAHFPHFNVPIFWWGKYVVTIHDLIKHLSRGVQTTTRQPIFYWFKYLNYKILVWLAVKRATKIITPSNYWKEELIRRYHLPREKVIVTYEGVDKKFSIFNFQFSKRKILEKYKIKTPFIIYTGSLYPHKNVEVLIKAVKKLNKKIRLYLVIVCARNIFYHRFLKKVEKLEVKDYVNFVGFVPDEKLVTLYQQAEAFVFPSLIEGFGLPGLEAMACGLPVLASDIPVFREIYKDAVIYFDPFCSDDLAEKIKKILKNKKLKEELKLKAKKLISFYSWEKMARKTIKIYRNLEI